MNWYDGGGATGEPFSPGREDDNRDRVNARAQDHERNRRAFEEGRSTLKAPDYSWYLNRPDGNPCREDPKEGKR